MEETPSSADLAGALAAWRATLGADRVVTGGERLELVNRTTFATPQHAPALLEPQDRDEVAACLQIARHFHVPLHPLSTGRNWGYGSSVPPHDGCVVLSLARLDRIIEHHEELAYVTVEPGVTFRHLADFLRERGSRLLPPLSGASPDTSLIGNVLERGIGKGPYEDMAARSCACEIILATGQVIQTGFASLPGAVAAPLWTHGPGPSLQGLFHQSNFGVVTRMTLWLEPAPQLKQLAVFRLRDLTLLAPIIDALRGLLLRNGHRLQVQILNDYRFLSQTRRYPYDQFDGSVALPRAWVEQELSRSVSARWIGGATLWADSLEELELHRRALASYLQPFVGELHFEEPRPGQEAPSTADALQSAYWRKRELPPPDPNPDRDRCGVLWLTPVLPMLGSLVAQVAGQIEALVLEHALEPSISLRLSGGRAVQAIVGLFYDREAAAMDERATRCAEALRSALYAEGLYPYRLSIHDMGSLPYGGDYAEVLSMLKALLDPEGILSPGRYVPS